MAQGPANVTGLIITMTLTGKCSLPHSVTTELRLRKMM